MHLYYDHTMYSFPLYTFLWPEDGPQWPKHVVVGLINRIQDSCFLTYPTPSISEGSLPFIQDHIRGTAVAQWLRCCATNRRVAGSIPAGVIGIFHWHKGLPIALWRWGRLSLWQKWVPGAFPAGKGGRCVRLSILPPSCTVVMKSGNLNFLEPSEPLQASNGTALPFIYLLEEHITGKYLAPDQTIASGAFNKIRNISRSLW